MLGILPPEHNSDWKDNIGVLVHTYNCTQNSTMGFSPYFLRYRRQPQISIDVTLQLTLKSITAPPSTKYFQKLRDCIRWAHRKADLFQQKEAWHHKCNYNKYSKAVSLRMGDMVLVCVTAFNREYVVEQQPYPNLPVYMVCPIGREGHSHTLH